jgi:hypothetical protein
MEVAFGYLAISYGLNEWKIIVSPTGKVKKTIRFVPFANKITARRKWRKIQARLNQNTKDLLLKWIKKVNGRGSTEKKVPKEFG